MSKKPSMLLNFSDLREFNVPLLECPLQIGPFEQQFRRDLQIVEEPDLETRMENGLSSSLGAVVLEVHLFVLEPSV